MNEWKRTIWHSPGQAQIYHLKWVIPMIETINKASYYCKYQLQITHVFQKFYFNNSPKNEFYTGKTYPCACVSSLCGEAISQDHRPSR